MTEKETQDIGLSRCSLLRRLAAIVYDTVIVSGLLLIAAAVASMLGSGDQQAFRDPLFTLYLIAVWFFYMAVFWMYGGMTVGMRAWKIKILPDTEPRITWATCLVRFLTAFLSFFALGAGLIWSIFDAKKRCWHDMLSQSGLYHLR